MGRIGFVDDSMMTLMVSAKIRAGLDGTHLQLDGWRANETGPALGPVAISLSGAPQSAALLWVALDPAAVRLTATTSGGSQHYFRLADATLRPLPAEALLLIARGDAYVALSPGAQLLADGPAIARFLHLRDYFNAARLAEGVLEFLAQESGQAEFPEDVAVIVVEAR